MYSKVARQDPSSGGGVIQVESADIHTNHSSAPYFILPEHQEKVLNTYNKENINSVSLLVMFLGDGDGAPWYHHGDIL